MEVLVETKNLKKYFKTPFGNLHALDGISLSIVKGETLGVVGESGCGKSTLGRTILRLIEPTGGEIIFRGRNVTRSGSGEMRNLRKDMQIIFQDPYSSLNPRMTVSDIIAEPIRVNKLAGDRRGLSRMVKVLMDKVELSRRLAEAYPHELDGGRRQRIGIARALSVNPSFIVCDEPVSALDVSVQAQILNLMMDLQEELGLTYLFITHNLSVVKHISTQIMVMYLGQCVERASSSELFKNPLHPYTRALLGAIPRPSLNDKHKHHQILKGEVTSPINPKPGCRFSGRCREARPSCQDEECSLKEALPGHFVACGNCFEFSADKQGI